MSFRRRCLAMVFTWLALVATVPAAELLLPPIDGQLEGDFTPLKLSGAPPLHWTLTMRNGGPGERRVDAFIKGPGTSLKIEAALNTAGEGTWKLTEAEIDIGPWFAALVPELGEALADLTAAGKVYLTAEGTWHEGRFGGRANVRLRDGQIESAAQKIKLEDVALDLAIEDLAQRRSVPAQQLTWSRGRYDVVPLGAGRVVFSLAGDRLSVDEASISAFGGKLALAAFAFTFGEPDIAVEARVEDLEIEQLLPLLPPVLSAASGKVDGNVVLKHGADGLEIGKGRLALRSGNAAQIRLSPTPGLISGSLPPAVLKYYPGLGQIETGQIPLQADVLEIEFTPDGDSAGRTASIVLKGGPVDPKLRAPIDLSVNVRGPLENLIKFGTSSKLKFGGVH